MDGGSVEATTKMMRVSCEFVQIHMSRVRKPILNYNEMSRIDKGDYHCNWRQKRGDETQGVDEGWEAQEYWADGVHCVV